MPRAAIHRIQIFAAALLAAACGPTPPQAPPPSATPSVLIVTLDTARADRFGFDGYPEPTSPHLDRLAADSLVFTRAIAQASVTPVSHASIFTGLNPYRHGLRVFGSEGENHLVAEQLTLAEILGSLGYATAAFISAFPASELYGLGQGFDVFDEDFAGGDEEDPGQRRADATTGRALAWLAEAPEKFFLWVHYFDPHDTKILPPADLLAGLHPDTATEEDYRTIYDREIAYMDAEIGRLLAALREAGRYDELLIVVVADHGQGLGDHGWWSHAILYQEQLRVPLLVKLPRSRPEKPRRIDFQVRTVDIVPTVLDALGLSVDAAPFDGRSLLPLAAAGTRDPGLVAYADSLGMATFVAGPGLADEVKDEMLLMVSDGRWKYIHHVLRPAESELYDLANDPRELANVLARHPGEARRLQADLQARDPFRRETDTPPVEISEEDRRRLEALGYVQ